MITQLAVSGYRSLRNVSLTLGPLNLITGPNGSGKSSLYRSLRLLSEIALGRAIASLAAEGGLSSTLWAGPEKISRGMRDGSVPVQGTVRSDPVSLKLGFSSEDYSYAIDMGLPEPSRSRFSQDPEIKAEAIWVGAAMRPSSIVAQRRGHLVRIRNSDTGEWDESWMKLSASDSMVAQYANHADGVELLHLRERIRAWRFYDDLRTDRDAPARKPQVGTFTPILSSDGSDIGSAIQTIQEIGDAQSFHDTIADAFDNAVVEVGPQFDIQMRQYGLLRPLAVTELSDGTLRYILLAAALLSPRPPELMILNEPEASLHPDLIGPLARLLIKASENCQIVVVSHSTSLVKALKDERACTIVELYKDLGETFVVGEAALGWKWPSR